MLCPGCSKLAFSQSNKTCVRCKSIIHNNISVLCDLCSTKNKQCSACLKNLVTQSRTPGCGCGGKK